MHEYVTQVWTHFGAEGLYAGASLECSWPAPQPGNAGACGPLFQHQCHEGKAPGQVDARMGATACRYGSHP